MEKGIDKIPFVKPVRVGNYKVWRSRYKVSVSPTDEDRRKVAEESQGRRKAVSRTLDIEQINVSNLDGTWSVRIPQTSGMFGVIVMAFGNYGEADRDMFLTNLFGNMLNVCLVDNVYIQDGFSFLMQVMQYPYMLLPEKEMEKRLRAGMKAVGIDRNTARKNVARMIEYRRTLYGLIETKKNRYIEEYERQMLARRAADKDAEKDLDGDALAEKAMEILDGSSDGDGSQA